MHSDVINEPVERLEVNINLLKWRWCGRRLLRPPTRSLVSIKRRAATRDVNINTTADSLMNWQQNMSLFYDVNFNYSWAILTDSIFHIFYLGGFNTKDFFFKSNTHFPEIKCVKMWILRFVCERDVFLMFKYSERRFKVFFWVILSLRSASSRLTVS